MTNEKVKNEKKGNNKKLVLVMAIAMLLAATVVATFAYFASRTEINNTLNIVANIDDASGSFIATASNIELNITAANMQEKVANTVAATATGNLNVEYYLGKETGLTCQYDINYEWVSSNDANPYTITNESKNEFTYEISDGTNTIISERNFVASNVRGKQKLGTGYIYNASTSEPTRKTYQINAKFYNLEENQSNNANKNWELKFYVDNIICGVDVDSTYTLSGVLLDDNGNPIPNATVATYSEPRYTTTDSNGAFTISGLEKNETHEIYFVPGKTILEVSALTKSQISAITGVKSGTFTTSTTSTITMDGNYSIGSVDLAEVAIIPPAGTPLLSTIQALAGTTSGTGNVVNETIGSYTNILYTGANPNNFVEFNGELWRIIGVYNEDTHGKTGQQLVKLIKKNNILPGSNDTSVDYAIKNMGIDYKFTSDFNSFGSYLLSSGNVSGSNEWSDSQLMMMLNGFSALGKGKLYNGNTLSYEYTMNNDGYVVLPDPIVGAMQNYTIFRNPGGYLTETRETNKSVYIPYSACSHRSCEYSANTSQKRLESTMGLSAQNMVEEVTWHVGGVSNTQIIASNLYSSERGNNVCTTVGSSNSCTPSTTSTVRSTTWEGKIGLMYPSDYAYSTSGGTTITRSACLSANLDSWSATDYSTDCVGKSWILNQYPNDWFVSTYATITPYANSSSKFMTIGKTGNLATQEASQDFWIRPTVYLKSNILITSGDGSENDPYVLSM